MCGFFGYISFNRDVRDLISESRLDCAMEVIKPRGPDEQRIERGKNWVMGHSRLAILDLDSRSAQPMTDGEGNWIVFNGEIYNYIELRKELVDEGEIFYTEGDTEVLLKGLIRFGPVFLRKVTGMFSFCWYNENSGQAVMARDRMGVKPLVFLYDEDGLSFGSDLRAISALGLLKGKKSEKSQALFFLLGYVPAPYTIEEKIKKLLPAHYAVANCRQYQLPVVTPYWQPDQYSFRDSVLDEGEIFDEFEELLKNAVSIRMRSDVSVGLLLSSGIDSSTLAASAALNDDKLPAFTMGFKDPSYDETGLARQVAKVCSHPFNSLSVCEDNIEEDLHKIQSVYDEPFADSSSIPFYYLCREVSARVKVAMSGDGGDELALGYPWQNAFRRYAGGSLFPPILRTAVSGILSRSERLRYPLSLWSGKDRRDQWVFIKTGLTLEQLSGLYYGETSLVEALCDYFDDLSSRVGDVETHGDWICKMDLLSYLPDDLLVKSDRTSMAFGLEIREPLLDHKLLEFLMSIPARYRYDSKGNSKLLQRDFLRRNGLEVVLSKEKQGFNPPLLRWLEERLTQYESEKKANYESQPRFSIQQNGKVSDLSWDSLLTTMNDRFSQYRWRLIQQF